MKKKIIAILIVVALLAVGLIAIPSMVGAASNNFTHLQLTPDNVTLVVGTTQQFTAQAYDNNNQPVANVNYFWLVTAGGGTISPTGLFTAGSEGTYNNTVEVVAVQGTTMKLATATVTVVTSIGTLNSVQITPANANVAPGGTIQFNAQGYDSNKVAIPNLTYTWSGEGTVGTVSTNGLFTAGTTTGTYTIQVTAAQGTATATGTTTITVTTNPTTTTNTNHGLNRFFNLFKGYFKNIGSDNFLGGQWQVKNSSGGIDTYSLISGVVQTASATALTIIPNGQTNPITYALMGSTVIQPKNTTFAANDKVIVLTINNQVTMVSKITAPSTSQLPPGLKKQDNGNRQGKDTPPGWSRGNKTGWNTNSSNGDTGSETNGD